ncbi:uncharacterized protein [Montipora capricornis]|uniref:uncharacterized protein isoform X2 n=1 Tax=Montipora capricornis TaxID=246305 RepID=UPI0035F1D2BA
MMRTAFTYLSGISTCAVAWVIFGLDSKSQFSENSSKDFMVMTAILVGLGVLLALISHVGTKEPLSKEANPDIPLTRLSTLLAANFAVSLTSFIPSDADRKLMTRLETAVFYHCFFTCCLLRSDVLFYHSIHHSHDLPCCCDSRAWLFLDARLFP